MRTEAETADAISELDALCRRLAGIRESELLILYYPELGRTMQQDVESVYTELRESGKTREDRLPHLDVLLHTWGGDPVAGYRLAQTIRDFADHVDVLVPTHAYSSGTLLALCADEIRMGDYAGLSPIDITILEPGQPRAEEIELASIDQFIEFAISARERAAFSVGRTGSADGMSSYDNLLVKLVEQVGAIKVGKYFRGRQLTARYAEVLLDSHMFASAPDAVDRRQAVIANLLTRAPAHEFHMDYVLCRAARLSVARMPVEEFDLAKRLVDHLSKLTRSGILCPNLADDYRIPFVRFYPASSGKEEDSGDAERVEAGGSARAGNTPEASGTIPADEGGIPVPGHLKLQGSPGAGERP